MTSKIPRELDVAIPIFAYKKFFQRPLIQEIVMEDKINLLVFDDQTQNHPTMGNLVKFRQAIMQALTEYLKSAPSKHQPAVEKYVVFDTERDHYQLMSVGWEDRHRVYFCILHFDIKGDKIWLQENNTDYDIVGRLEELGVTKSDLVIGFLPADVREMTDFAVV